MSPKKHTKKKSATTKGATKPSMAPKGTEFSAKAESAKSSKVNKSVSAPSKGVAKQSAASAKDTGVKAKATKKPAVAAKLATTKKPAANTDSTPNSKVDAVPKPASKAKAAKSKSEATAAKVSITPTVKGAKATAPKVVAVKPAKTPAASQSTANSTKPATAESKAKSSLKSPTTKSAAPKAKSTKPLDEPGGLTPPLDGLVVAKGTSVKESKPPKKSRHTDSSKNRIDLDSQDENAKDLETTSVATNLSSAKSHEPESTPKKVEDFSKFRAILLSIRERLKGDVHMMSQEALGTADGAVDNHAPIHPAEVGSHSFEQEFTLNLLSSDGDRLGLIEAALEKIADGSYGSCEECGVRIPKARLEIIPDTPFCVKCASKLEG